MGLDFVQVIISHSPSLTKNYSTIDRGVVTGGGQERPNLLNVILCRTEDVLPSITLMF